MFAASQHVCFPPKASRTALRGYANGTANPANGLGMLVQTILIIGKSSLESIHRVGKRDTLPYPMAICRYLRLRRCVGLCISENFKTFFEGVDELETVRGRRRRVDAIHDGSSEFEAIQLRCCLMLDTKKGSWRSE